MSDETKKFEELVESIKKGAIADIAKSAQGKLVAHVDSLIKEVKNLLATQDEGMDKVIEYLETQEKAKSNLATETEVGYKNIVKSIKELAKRTQTVTVSNHPKTLTKQEVEGLFTNALDVIQNILIKQNEIPSAVSVGYTSEGKVSRIVETYDGYKLTTVIRYTDGRVSSWSTTQG